MQYTFDDYVLDKERRELTRGSKAIAVGPQVFDLLLYLLQNREHVVSKDDLLDGVWGGRSSIPRCASPVSIIGCRSAGRRTALPSQTDCDEQGSPNEGGCRYCRASEQFGLARIPDSLRPQGRAADLF